MKIFRGLKLLLGAFGLTLITQLTAAAGVADGSVPLVCVPLSVTECGADDECQRGSAASINLPQFLQVNVQAMTIRAVEQGRQSPIGSVAHQQGKLILQGVDGMHGWTLIIAEDSGLMSATIAGATAGYIIF